MAIFDRVRSAWNAFTQVKEPHNVEYSGSASFGGISPSRPQLRYTNNRTIISSIYNRISIDVADVEFRHVKVDEEQRYLEDVDSGLQRCLGLEANIDQAPRAFRQDIFQTLFDGGTAVIVPVDTSINPNTNEIFDIYTLRVGTVVHWYPKHVRVSLYNEAENKGIREEITLEKRYVAIIENPLYTVMNAPNSTLQRLNQKLALLDAVDEQSSSGKLDLIIQLPYTIKSEARKLQAEQRRKDIEFQLKDSKYGIAYADGTEKITQLNRPAENNLMGQVEYLTNMLYGQLGITESVMNGTADEKTMINYYNRTIKPIVQATVEAMQRTFLGDRVDRTEKIVYFRDPFKFATLAEMADIADKFGRNEVLSSNEIRGYIGIPPAKDPKADQLVNSNMPQPIDVSSVPTEPVTPDPELEAFDEIDKTLNSVFEDLGVPTEDNPVDSGLDEVEDALSGLFDQLGEGS